MAEDLVSWTSFKEQSRIGGVSDRSVEEAGASAKLSVEEAC